VKYVRGIFLLTNENSPRPAGDLISGGEFFVCTEEQVRSLLIQDGPLEYSPTIIRDYGHWMRPRNVFAADALPRNVNDIRLLKRLPQNEDHFHRVFVGQKDSNGVKVHVHLMDLTAGGAALMKKAEREVRALQTLHEHGKWVPQIIDTYQHIDGYVGEMMFYSLSDSDAPTLQHRRRDKSWACDRRMRFALSALTGLADLQSLELSEPFVHRNISPTTLLVRHDDRALFTGFELSRVPGAETIAPSIVQKKTVEAWIAPEMVEHGYAAATKESDVYALCRTLQSAFDPEDEVFAILEQGAATNLQQRPSAQQLRDELRRLIDGAKHSALMPQPATPSAEYWSEGMVVNFHDHRYRVDRRLGEGRMGITYRVVQINSDDQDGSSFVAKTAKSDQEGKRLIEAYGRARQIKHDRLAQLYEFVSPDKIASNSFVALMQYLPGHALSEYISYAETIAEERELLLGEQIEEWLRMLLQALAAIHRSGCVHGDVSAANIIVNPSQSYTASLTDFDLVTRIGDVLASPGTLRYCAPESAKDAPARASHDVYALAAVLFDIAFGRDPFGGKGKDSGIVWAPGERGMLGRIADFLNKATHPDPSQRFGDADVALRWFDLELGISDESTVPIAEEAIEALIHAHLPRMGNLFAQLEVPAGAFRQQEVTWLHKLLSTYAASLVGNAETRGMESSFARDTYVETELDRHVAQELRAGKAQLVILCGNAGDGKTAFLQKLAEQFGLPDVRSAQRLWEHTLPDGRRMLLNLDGAAAWRERTADDLMNEVMQPFLDGRRQPELLHLVAVNNGRLLEWIEHAGDSPLTNHLRAVLLGEESERSGAFDHVRYIDLNERSLVGSAVEASTDAVPKFIDELIRRMSGADDQRTWAPCATCSAQNRCTARRSMTALEDPEKRTRIVMQLSR
ncbi:MAG: protein kinase, partial [Chloroflexi bacterium]|nr:protein kinase [Chloroflexota bacterium]